jgi:hypothetical protein
VSGQSLAFNLVIRRVFWSSEFGNVMDAPKSNLVFVVGVFRSGTSLLHSLLNQHAEIGLMYEADVWFFPPSLAGLRFRGDWLEAQEYFNEALTRHRLILGRGNRGLEHVRTPEALYQTYADLKGARLSGEKSPVYCSHLEFLSYRYPGAAFILVWRNPVETYRSLIRAGRSSRFFRQPGMLSRIIYSQEQMIRQAARLERTGARVHHVGYSNMVDHTEAVCRNLCDFLGVKFDPQMMELSKADLSSVYKAPHHDFLRRGIIERQVYSEQYLSPTECAKLERYRRRWERIIGPLFGAGSSSGTQSEPGFVERTYHSIAGRAFVGFDLTKRVMFEFLPVDWLRAYRLLKHGLLVQVRTSPSGISTHWPTVLFVAVYLAGLAYVHFLANPHLMFMPFYLLPCAALTLIVNRYWGIAGALAGAVLGPVMQWLADDVYRSPLILVWNCIMRFAIFVAIVLLLDLARIHATTGNSARS